MKNICFVCYNISFMGGSEKATTTVANELSNHYNVHIISICEGQPNFKLDERIKCVGFNLNFSRLRKGIIPVTKMLKAYYKENNIEMSFLVENYCSFLCSFTSLLTKTKQIYCDHGAIMSQWHRTDLKTIRRICSFLTYRTIVLTNESKNDYIKRFHMKKHRVVSIPNWIEVLNQHPCYNSNSNLIMSAGRIAIEKCFHTHLPMVAKLVKKQHPSWKWHIYGDGEYLEQTRAKLKELNIEDFVILMGKVDNLVERYKDYAMFVLTSDREGLPLVLLEAKANGLPAVAFDVKTGPKEIVNDNEDGFLVPAMNDELMASAICKLIENKELRLAFSNHALSTIDLFSKDKILKKWIDFIEQG